jgi:hypothetical protein
VLTCSDLGLVSGEYEWPDDRLGVGGQRVGVAMRDLPAIASTRSAFT